MEYKANELLSDLVTNRFHGNHSFPAHKSNNLYPELPANRMLPYPKAYIHQSSKIPVKVVVDSYMESSENPFQIYEQYSLVLSLSESWKQQSVLSPAHNASVWEQPLPSDNNRHLLLPTYRSIPVHSSEIQKPEVYWLHFCLYIYTKLSMIHLYAHSILKHN